MLVKGVIEKRINEYQYKVRIPRIHQTKGASNATQTEDIAVALICMLPGILPSYGLGDVVYVEFEKDIYNMPVIMGCFPMSSENSNSSAKLTDILINDTSNQLNDTSDAIKVLFDKLNMIENTILQLT